MTALPVLALLPAVLATAALERGWRGRMAVSIAVPAAFVLIAMAIVLASLTLGPGRGLSWIAVALSLIAAPFVFARRTRKPRKVTRERDGAPAREWPDWPLRWTACCLVSGAASFALAAACAVLLPVADGTRVMAALLIVTFAWPLLGAWVLGTAHKGRVTAIQLCIAAAAIAAAAAGFLL